MDCKTENAVRTFLRIEVIILQGLLQGVFLSLIGVCLIPFVPFIVAFTRWRVERNRLKWHTRVMLTPMWMLSGFFFGLANPIGILFKAIADVKEIARVEWENRWRLGQPKKPNGHPLPIRTPEDQERLDAAVMMGVVEDYNEEAKSYGQGIDFDDAE